MSSGDDDDGNGDDDDYGSEYGTFGGTAKA